MSGYIDFHGIACPRYLKEGYHGGFIFEDGDARHVDCQLFVRVRRKMNPKENEI